MAGAEATSIGDDAEGFHYTEIKQLATSGITLDALLSGSEVQELFADGAISRAQVTQMYQGIPKEVVGKRELVRQFTIIINFQRIVSKMRIGSVV